MANEQRLNRITKFIKTKGKNGTWIGEIAKELEIHKNSVRYYISGNTIGNRHYGGFLAEKIEPIKKMGRHNIFRWKK